MNNPLEKVLKMLRNFFNDSLRSKRFQSSYCAKVLSPPPPPSFLFFCSRPNFSRRTRAETLATQAILTIIGGLFLRCSVFCITKSILKN